MTNSFAMPGQAYQVDNQIARRVRHRRLAAALRAGDHRPGRAARHRPGRGRGDRAGVRGAGRAAIPGVRIADYATTHDPAFVTQDGRSTFALVYTAPVTGFGGANLGPGDRAGPLTAALPAGWHAGVTGTQALHDGQPSVGQGHRAHDRGDDRVGRRRWSSWRLVFASFLAVLPLLIGGISVLATFLLVGGLTEVTGVSQIVEFLIALIGLGVAIDYSLLVVSRWREERAAGRDNADAVLQAMTHAGRAVVFSGLTVAIGLVSMIVLPVPMLRSVGYGGVLVPLVSVAVAVTLLPVILATAGPRLDWPRLRTERRRQPGLLGLGPPRVPAPLAGRAGRAGRPDGADAARAVTAPGRAGQLGRRPPAGPRTTRWSP